MLTMITVLCYSAEVCQLNYLVGKVLIEIGGANTCGILRNSIIIMELWERIYYKQENHFCHNKLKIEFHTAIIYTNNCRESCELEESNKCSKTLCSSPALQFLL